MNRNSVSEITSSITSNNNTKKKEENPLVFLGINKDEMSTYESQQRTSHQRKCHAGQVYKDGKIQSTLTGGHPQTPVLLDINDDEMLKTQYTQHELDEIEYHQSCQEKQEKLERETGKYLKWFNKITQDFISEEVPENEKVTKICTTCGAMQQVHYSQDKCKYVSKSAKKHRLVLIEDENESSGYDIDMGEEVVTFINIEAEMPLGTEDPDIEKINPYVKTWHYVGDELVYAPINMTYSSKVSKTDVQRNYEEVNSQICNLANCLNDNSPVLKNWARKVIRLFSKSDDSEVSLVPKTSGHKQVAVNMYKKIIREYGHYIEATYPETPSHLSVKSLGIHTWNFQLATKVKQDGKWVARENVDIDAIMNILKAFSNTELNYPTIELVENEIIMYGDSNQRMSWQDKGKRSGKDGKVVPAVIHDKMRTQSFQIYNMDYMIEQSTYHDNTLIDHGVDGVFDGDIINPVADETHYTKYQQILQSTKVA